MESTHLPLRKAKLPTGQLFMVVIGDIAINRKMLADMAVRDPKAFSAVVEKAKAG